MDTSVNDFIKEKKAKGYTLFEIVKELDLATILPRRTSGKYDPAFIIASGGNLKDVASALGIDMPADPVCASDVRKAIRYYHTRTPPFICPKKECLCNPRCVYAKGQKVRG